MLSAIHHNDIKKVKKFRKPTVDFTISNGYALMEAAEIGRTNIVDLLLKDGRSDPTVHKSRGLREAAAAGYADIVELFLQDGRADPTASGYFSNDNAPIIMAANRGHIDVVALLFQDPRVRDVGLPFPDPDSKHPLERMLGEIVMTSMRATHKIAHEHGFAQNPRLAEHHLLSQIFEYNPTAQKRKKEKK